MMRSYSRLGATVLVALSSLSLTAALPDPVVIVPQPGGDFSVISEQQDPLAKCPRYDTDQVGLIVQHGGWEGRDDYRAVVRFALAGKELFAKIDVTDDLTRIDPTGVAGDRIAVRFASFTTGPLKKRDRDKPYDQLTLYPQPEKETCRIKVDAQDPDVFVDAKADLIRTIDGYSIVLRLPTDDWELPPKFAGQLRCQIEFFDADEKLDPSIDNHRFTLFPVPRASLGGETQVRHFGRLKFVDQVWARLVADKVIFSGKEITYRARWGNLTDEPLSVEISAAKDGKGDSIQLAEPIELAPGTAESDTAVTLDFSQAKAGEKYEIKSAAGRLFETSPHALTYTGYLNFCHDHHGIQGPPRGRTLGETNPRETIRTIAGGGTVLWNSGTFDGSGADQNIKLRPVGKHVIELGDGEADVPFALFGGRDPVDGMNEPLVLKMGDLSSKESLSPVSLTGDRYSQVSSKKERLLLVGVAYDYVGADGIPEIVVRTKTKELLRQRLPAPPGDGIGSRHSHVLRVWLERRQKEVEIENVSVFGPRVEIDFLAVLGGGPALDFPRGEPALRFTGDNSAEVYSRQLAATLYFMRNYLVDNKGNDLKSRTWSSLPGGRYSTASAAEYGLMMSELARWGAIEDARRMANSVDRYLQFSASGGASAGQMAIASALCQLWRYDNRDSGLLQRHWIRHVMRTVSSMESEMRTHPFGLPNSEGEFGVEGRRQATTAPMYGAASAALRNAIIVAENSSYSQSAPSLERTLSELERNFRRHMIVSDRDLQLSSASPFPQSWTIPAGPVIGLLSRGNLIYGRYEDGKPLLYNGKTRVFDTPYLFSTVSFMSDAGFTLADDFSDALKTSYDYQQSFSPLASQQVRRTQGLIDYKSIATHQWNTMAELQLDSLNVANRSIEALIRATFDESTKLPVDVSVLPSASVSPYLPGEQPNMAPNGEVSGMTGDEVNAMIAVNHVRLARLIGGLDDADPNELKLTPRLPDKWEQVSYDNWRVSHNANTDGNTVVQAAYKRAGPTRYTLNLSSSDELQKVTVRFGPFDVLTRSVRISGTGGSASVTPVKEGLYAWVTRTYDRVRDLSVTASAR